MKNTNVQKKSAGVKLNASLNTKSPGKAYGRPRTPVPRSTVHKPSFE